MAAKEVKAFAEEVYKQCIDKKMTCKDFELFAHYIEVRKRLVVSALYRQNEKLALPNPEAFL